MRRIPTGVKVLAVAAGFAGIPMFAMLYSTAAAKAVWGDDVAARGHAVGMKVWEWLAIFAREDAPYPMWRDVQALKARQAARAAAAARVADTASAPAAPEGQPPQRMA